jgi:hypothetical protein
LRHDPVELARLALEDRDEVDHRVAALDCRSQARRVGHVPDDRVAAQRLQAIRVGVVAHERAHGAILDTQRTNDA